MNGEHPTVAGKIAKRKVYFRVGSECEQVWVNIEVTKCSNYYLYNFFETDGCNRRYCGTD